MLADIEKINPNFYPVPLEAGTSGHEAALVSRRADSYLTRKDFERLYDVCGDVLHMRNPFQKPNR
jgi:hypothetical protein